LILSPVSFLFILYSNVLFNLVGLYGHSKYVFGSALDKIDSVELILIELILRELIYI